MSQFPRRAIAACYRYRLTDFVSILSQCRYGDGPYYIKVQAHDTKDKQNTFSFVIELASRKYLPHSVFTFLTLIKYQFFNGFLLVGGDSSSMTMRSTPSLEEALSQTRKVLGMQDTILMFGEAAPQFLCGPNAIGFDGLGPSLQLHTAASGNEGHSASCFGSVVRGEESFAAIAQAVAGGKTVEIIQMDHLVLE